MQFFIEQIAIAPRDPVAARELLAALGLTEWSEDTVTAAGQVANEPARNKAQLAFNYQAAPDNKLEFEVLHYTEGLNWLMLRPTWGVSHFGMHVNAEELLAVRQLMHERGIRVVQEVVTQTHTNPVIAGKRHYQYVIFDTHTILGVDLKFIVRLEGAV